MERRYDLMANWSPGYDSVAWLPFGFEVGSYSVGSYSVDSYPVDGSVAASAFGQGAGVGSEACTKRQYEDVMLVTFGLEGCMDGNMLAVRGKSELRGER